MRGLIVAVSPEGVIGIDGKMPWHYSEDLKRFKRITINSTIIMGRVTWESIGSKPLPGRRNIVITSRKLTDVECFPDIQSALDTCSGTVWFIGGARLYQEAINHCDLMDVTYVPDRIEAPNAVHFPKVEAGEWELESEETNDNEPSLRHCRYRRK
ncbi:MAG: dihydrofolate reductase [Gammaproteobacteria bacterium]|nr:dihydrofolate reductase [Gammaproteobacteria bacterium]